MVVYVALVAAVRHLDAARLRRRGAGRARRGGVHRRRELVADVPLDPAAARGARPRRDERLQLHHGLERVHLRDDDPRRARRRSTRWLDRPEVSSSACTPTTGASVMAASTIITLPVMIFFVLVQRRLSGGHGGRSGEGMSDRPRAARRTACSGRASSAGGPGLAAATSCATVSPASCTSGRTPSDPAGLAALSAPILRGHRPEALIGVDEEGGNVTRLESADGLHPARAAQLGLLDDVETTRAAGAALAERARMPPAANVVLGTRGRREHRPREPGDRRAFVRRRPPTSSPDTSPRWSTESRTAGSPRASSTSPATATRQRLAPRAAPRRPGPRGARSRAPASRSDAAIAAGVDACHDRPHRRPGVGRRAGDTQPHPHSAGCARAASTA